MLLFVLLVALLTPTLALICDTDCQQKQRDALVELYTSLGGPNWPRNQGWADINEYCSWDGVQCCKQTAAASSAACALSGAVTGLDLSVNNLTGTWPASALGDLADSLQFLNLRGNNLQGSLPESIGELQLLASLYVDDNSLTGALPDSLSQLQNLTQLTAAANKLAGTIPRSLLGLQKLQWLLLNDNQLTGQVPGQLFALPELQLLSLQGNLLQGPLPTAAATAGSPASQGGAALVGGTPTAAGPPALTEVRLARNRISGSIPTFIAQLPTLLLDISHNQLTGSLPAALSSNSVLQELFLKDNRLSGTLSPGLFSSSLQVLDLSSNQLTGTVPAVATSAYALEVVNLSNNSLTGDIPADIGRLVNLQQADWSANRFTAQDALPATLIVDSSQPGTAADPAEPALLCRPVVSAKNPTAQIALDPSSYGYEGCYCKDPWRPVVSEGASSGAASMSCTLDKEGDTVKLAYVLGPLLAVLGVALIALAVMGAAWRGGWAGFVQRFSDQAEKKSPPDGTAKDVTLVLTDVQGSTELWEWDQQLASDAFKLHDRILRQYMTHFYGYEVSTEGDAFLVAFHEPFDAAAWCLCVQMALHYADWPAPLLMHKSTCLDTADTLEQKRRQRQDRWQSKITEVPVQHGHQDVEGATGLDGNAWAGGIDTMMQAPLVPADEDFEDTSGSSNAMEARMAARMAAACSGNGKAVDRGVLFRGLRVRMSIATGGVDSVRLHSVTQRAEYVGEVLRKVQAVGETPQGGQIIMDSETFRGIHSRLPELGGVVLEATQKLLRSRVGPSATELASMFSNPPGTELMQRDAGWMKNSTDFTANQPLPAVNRANSIMRKDSSSPDVATPINTATTLHPLADAYTTPQNTPVCGLTNGRRANSIDGPMLPVEGGRRRSAVLNPYMPAGADLEEGGIASSYKNREQLGFLHRAAVLFGLDQDDEDGNHSGTNDTMATFTTNPTTTVLPRSPIMGLGRLRKRDRQRPERDNGLNRNRRRSSLSYGVMVIDMGVHQLTGLAQKINLVQVMPCGLEDRARYFPRLDSLRRETPGYFDAPAAGMVPLSPSGDLKGVTIPPVTIVFCTIDKYSDLVEANRPAAELALELYSDCVRWLLLVGGGYECQESEGTFMVAFSSADVAIEWCLMVQQVLKDMIWPASVLELPTCEEERDMHGNVMFRGPRVKMGVYSGTPTRVMPHTTTGRADYFGPLVNRAARYCHAAARGGQVLVPKELMCEVIGKWVMIDPVELLQSDRLLEFVAFFDEERRLWPWMFKRRSHWDMAMPAHFYPTIPPPPPVMGPLWQEAAAAVAATPHIPASVVDGGPVPMASPRAGRRVSGRLDSTIAEAPTEVGARPDAPLSVRVQPSDGSRGSSATLSPLASGAHGKKSFGGASSAAAADEAEMLGAADQMMPEPAGGMLGRLAPLHESAEGGSSRASEVDPNHRHSPLDDQAAGPPVVPPHLRRYSDLTQLYSRLGPQHLQALQMQYNQSLAGQSPPYSQQYNQPYSFLQPQQQYNRSSTPGPVFVPATLGPGFGQMGYLSARYRRPSYLSDVSGRYRRFSNMSDFSGTYPSSGVSTASKTAEGMPWPPLAPQQEPSSRRPSALSDFFPVEARSRRPSGMSLRDNSGGHVTTGLVGSRTDSTRSAAAPEPPAAASAMVDMLPAAMQQQQVQMQQQAQQLRWQLQQYQQQQTEQQMQQQMQPGAPWRWQLLKMQRAGPAVSAAAVGHGEAASVPQHPPLTAANQQQSISNKVSPRPAGQQQQQQQQQLQSSSAPAAAESHASPRDGVDTGSHTSPRDAAAAANAGRKGTLYTASKQQQKPLQQAVSSPIPAAGDLRGSATTSHAGGQSGPVAQRSSSTGNSGSRDTYASIGRHPSHTSAPSTVPAALLVQGLESQVLPGMLHSSNRLRLVSKRRRQMSYCFFQETSKPGVPADGADPKRLVGYSSSYGVPLGPHTGSGTPQSNYAPSDAAGSGPGPGGLATVGSGNGSATGKGSIGDSAGLSRRGSSRTSGGDSHDSSLQHRQSQTVSPREQADTAAPVDAPNSASAFAGVGNTLPGMAECDEEGSAAVATDADAAAAPAAAAAAAAAAEAGGSPGLQQQYWTPAVMDDYCGLPEIEPLPDVDVLESLRLAATTRSHRPSNVSTVTDSVAGFEGPNIGSMCAEIMRGRWLWIGELLVHDLGQFRFKGVAGVHSIVSVTSEELGGRTFPTTIRRGKGEQIRLGRGLLANVQMRPRARQPGWGPYAGQQLLQNPAPQPDLQHTQSFMPPGLGICHACSGIGLQTVGSMAPAAMDAAAAAGDPTAGAAVGLQHNHLAHQYSMGQPAAAVGMLRQHPGVPSAPVVSPQEIPFRRFGSTGDLRGLTAGKPLAPPQPGQLLHLGSAPEGTTAAAVAAALNALPDNGSASSAGGY